MKGGLIRGWKNVWCLERLEYIPQIIKNMGFGTFREVYRIES